MISLEDIEHKSPAFLQYMQAVDKRMRLDRITVRARPLFAFQYMAKDGLQILVPSQHASQVNEWFVERYGNQIKIDLCLGRVVILVRGDPYIMRLPITYGHWDGIFKVEDVFENMTSKLFEEMCDADRTDMVNHFVDFQKIFTLIRLLPSEITADIEIAILNISSQNPHFGLSKWASLQTAEKALKYYIKQNGQTAPHIHNLNKLLKIAEQHGLLIGCWPLLSMIQCDASVRYESKVGLDDAIYAHHAAIELAARVAQTFAKKGTTSPNKSRLKDLVVSFSHGVEKSFNGGLLFKFIMIDGEERLVYWRSDICFRLLDSLNHSRSLGRHSDIRKTIKGERDFPNIYASHPIRLFLANSPAFTQSDFEQQVYQVQEYTFDDCTNGLEGKLRDTKGKTMMLILDSVLVNYFIDYISKGIESGKKVGLFIGEDIGRTSNCPPL